jgi:hypothetical protein
VDATATSGYFFQFIVRTKDIKKITHIFVDGTTIDFGVGDCSCVRAIGAVQPCFYLGSVQYL